MMAGLKALVIIMGIAIIVAGTVLVTVIVRRGGEPAVTPTQTKAAIELPMGARVVETRLDGGRILMRIILSGGAERILIIDAGNGQRLATHEVTRKGKAP